MKDEPAKQEWKVGLTFVARDHPEVITSRFGRTGDLTLNKTLSRIAGSLRKNLRSTMPLTVELTVHLVSRHNANQIFEIARIVAPD